MATYAPTAKSSPGGDPFAALADPRRRQILERLAEQPLPVGELAHGIPISRPAVSQHLKVLKDAGLVTDRRAGNRRIYEVEQAGIHELRSYLDRFWKTALTTYQQAVDQTKQEAR